MNWLFTGLFASLIAFAPAWAQDSNAPPSCEKAFEDIDWAECAADAEPGSSAQLLAYMNLGTQAYAARDFENAAKFYDLSTPEGHATFSDVLLHTYRADTFYNVGRQRDALKDARAVVLWLAQGGVQLPPGQTLTKTDLQMIYAIILPILKAGGAEEFEPALAEFQSLPVEDWIDATNRASGLMNLGEYASALPLSEQALIEQPNHPGVLNNHCYLLALMDRGDEGVPYCERALAAVPNEAALFDSYAAALSSAERCEEAILARKRAQELAPSNIGYRDTLPCEAASN